MRHCTKCTVGRPSHDGYFPPHTHPEPCLPACHWMSAGSGLWDGGCSEDVFRGDKRSLLRNTNGPLSIGEVKGSAITQRRCVTAGGMWVCDKRVFCWKVKGLLSRNWLTKDMNDGEFFWCPFYKDNLNLHFFPLSSSFPSWCLQFPVISLRLHQLQHRPKHIHPACCSQSTDWCIYSSGADKTEKLKINFLFFSVNS